MSTQSDDFELLVSEIAGQAGRSLHPFEAGREAARRGEPITSSPYVPGSTNQKRFAEGYHSEKAAMKQAGQASREEDNQKPEGKTMTRTHRAPKPKKEVQDELIPDSRITVKKDDEVVEMPEEIRAILQQTDDAIYNEGIYKQQSNEFKSQMQDLMKQFGLSEVALPRGGKLLYSPGKPSVKYIAPKDQKKKDEEGESEEE